MKGDFDPLRALQILLSHGVRFVVIGGVAGRAWGSPLVTHDLDVCYERSPANYEALASALKEMQATLRGAPDDLPFQLDARTIAMGDSFTFNTIVGPLDCLGTPSGTTGYDDLAKNARRADLEDGLYVLIASLDDLLRMKRAAGRSKDVGAIEILNAIREEREN